MSAFLIALQFLTRLPISLPGMPAPAAVGRSLLSYPLVGLLLGAVLLSAQWVLQGQAPALQAALLLILWVGLTGGLHLDGLADSADAWLGGFGDRERTLTIMKDPRSGPIAVVTLVLVLLLKFCALLALVQSGQTLGLLLAPVLGRAAMLGLFLCTPYVRAGGLGQALAQHLPRGAAKGVLVATALVCVLVAGWNAVVALAVALVVFAGLRTVMLKRLGGTTGDTAGALLELLEVAVLVGLAL